MSDELIIREFLGELGKFQMRLSLDQVADENIFKEIEILGKELCVKMKPYPNVPKELLATLTETINLAKNQHPHLTMGADKVPNMVQALGKIFSLILINETHEDRKPGAPRII